MACFSYEHGRCCRSSICRLYVSGCCPVAYSPLPPSATPSCASRFLNSSCMSLWAFSCFVIALNRARASCVCLLSRLGYLPARCDGVWCVKKSSGSCMAHTDCSGIAETCYSTLPQPISVSCGRRTYLVWYSPTPSSPIEYHVCLVTAGSFVLSNPGFSPNEA